MPNVTPAGGGNIETASLAAALGEQDLLLVGALPLERHPPTPGTTRAALSGPAEISVDLEVDANEGAVALLEQDGLYQWNFEAEETSPLPASAKRGATPAQRSVRFRFPLNAAQSGTTRQRGLFTDWVVGQAQVLVFKFAGRFLLGQGVAFLERKVHSGLVHMTGDDLSSWTEIADFSQLALPSDRRARILLFIHGTFSSVRGGFAGLSATAWGRTFLQAARANYDAVVGFDHPTLSVDPLVNANALLKSLEARSWTQPVSIDAISHSRGGITLRSLTEYLLPATSLPVQVERAVFVAATNGGTELAEPKNWRTLIDVYTNLAAGTCRAIAAFPQAAPLALLFSELFKGVGVLAKVLVSEAITDKAVPGLAAMEPTGPFIRELNRTQPGQPSAQNSRYYAVTSNFQAKLALEKPSELPRKLLLALADGGIDQLMGVANDLVVHTASMTEIDPGAGAFIKDTLAFGENSVVYHTNYFLQPEVTKALTRWLQLASVEQADPERVRGVIRVGSAPDELPVHLDDDVLVLRADQSAKASREEIALRKPNYVVVERDFQQQQLRYAFRSDEALAKLDTAADVPLLDALNLHEWQASTQSEGHIKRVRSAGPQVQVQAGAPTATRNVVLDAGSVVAVEELKVPAYPITELVQESEYLSSADPTQRAAAKPLLPKFSAPAPMLLRGAPISEPAMLSAPASLARPVGAAAPAPGASAPEVPTTVRCNFLAEMDDEVQLQQTVSVDVTVAREALESARRRSALGSAEVSTTRKLIVELIAKKNFSVSGESRVELAVPELGASAQCVFDVLATDLGEGELVVRIRQGSLPLVQLSLKTNVVAQRPNASKRHAEDASIVEQELGPEPAHQLTIMEIERGGQHFYHFTLDSAALAIKDMYESKSLIGSREDYVKGIYADLEARYISSHSDREQFQRELREVGGDLWDQLIPVELQQTLWKFRDQITSIQVYSEEPFIPWELVHMKEPGQGLPKETRFMGQLGLVRWLHNVGWPSTQLRARKDRCFCVVPRYPHPDYKLPGAEAEADYLITKLRAKEVEPHAGPVRKLLETAGGFDFLHFSCHGAADSADVSRAELLLEGRVDGTNYVCEPLRVTAIEQLSSLVGPDGVRPIVTLNACQLGRAGYKLTSTGGFSRAFLRKGAGMFVAAMWSVGDETARTFIETLYERLIAGDELSQASVVAREAARAAGDSTWIAYTVYGNPHATLALV
jgi:hypothetical protein